LADLERPDASGRPFAASCTVVARIPPQLSPIPFALSGPSAWRAGMSNVVLTQASLLDRLLRLIRTSVALGPVGRLDQDTGLLGTGVGLDSIEILHLVAAIEEEFDLTIDDSELEVRHFETVRSLTALIRRKLASSPAWR